MKLKKKETSKITFKKMIGQRQEEINEKHFCIERGERKFVLYRLALMILRTQKKKKILKFNS